MDNRQTRMRIGPGKSGRGQEGKDLSYSYVCQDPIPLLGPGPTPRNLHGLMPESRCRSKKTDGRLGSLKIFFIYFSLGC